MNEQVLEGLRVRLKAEVIPGLDAEYRRVGTSGRCATVKRLYGIWKYGGGTTERARVEFDVKRKGASPVIHHINVEDFWLNYEPAGGTKP